MALGTDKYFALTLKNFVIFEKKGRKSEVESVLQNLPALLF